MGANDDDVAPWLSDECALLADAVARGIPVLGLCLGGQLLAKATGGVVELGPITEIGVSYVQRTVDGLLDEVISQAVPLRGGDIPAAQWHQDHITQLPDGAVLLMTNDACRVQAFRLGDTAYGLQMHPEVDAAIFLSWADVADEALERSGRDARQAAPRSGASSTHLIAAWRPVTRAWGELVWNAQWTRRALRTMTDRRISDTGRLIRIGLQDLDRARRLCASPRLAPLLADDAVEGDLLSDIAAAADPDTALLLLVRILEAADDREWRRLVAALQADADLRRRLIDVIGMSEALGRVHRPSSRGVAGAGRRRGPRDLAVGPADPRRPARRRGRRPRTCPIRSPPAPTRRSSTPCASATAASCSGSRPATSAVWPRWRRSRCGCPTSPTACSRRRWPSPARRSATPRRSAGSPSSAWASAGPASSTTSATSTSSSWRRRSRVRTSPGDVAPRPRWPAG